MSGTCVSATSHLFRWTWFMYSRRFGCRGISHSSEIYEATLRVCRKQLDLDLVADIHTLLAAHESSFDRRILDPHVGPAWLVAGNDRLEARADSIAEQHGRGDLSHIAFDFARGVFLHGAVARNRRELVVGIGRRVPGKDRFHDALS